jgi:transposase
MADKAQRRVVVLHEVAQGQLGTAEAAALLGVTARQVRRLAAAYRRAGAAALRHGNTGRQPAHTIAPEVRARVAALAQTTYRGCNQQHLAELLAEREGIALSRSSVRRILLEAGVAAPRGPGAPQHRRRRPRYPQAGMLVQVDASPHDWLEGRGPYLTLVAAIDDATNEVPAALFRAAEDAHGYFLLLRQLVTAVGIPLALYHDRHGSVQPPPKRAWTVAEQLAGRQEPTQFGRLLAELGIASIAAQSPQAKGRVERLFGTLQDRLVSELRLAEARTLAEANAALEAFLPRFNARFRVPAAQAGSAYRPLAASPPPETLFCFKYQRVVAADNTVQFAGQRLQLLPDAARLSWARATVEVHERLDGSLAVYHQGTCLAATAAPPDAPALRARGKRLATAASATPQAPPAPPPAPAAMPGPRKPAPSHPWRTPRPAHAARTKSLDTDDAPGQHH